MFLWVSSFWGNSLAFLRALAYADLGAHLGLVPARPGHFRPHHLGGTDERNSPLLSARVGGTDAESLTWHPSTSIPEGPAPDAHEDGPSPPSLACPLLLRPCGHGRESVLVGEQLSGAKPGSYFAW